MEKKENLNPKDPGEEPPNNYRILRGGMVYYRIMFYLVIAFLFQCVQSVEGIDTIFYAGDNRPGATEKIVKLEKEHGIIAKKAFPVVGTMGSDCVPTRMDFSPLAEVKPLTYYLFDVFAYLNASGKSPEVAERLASRRVIFEDVLKRQEQLFDASTDQALSRYWSTNASNHPAPVRLSFTVGHVLLEVVDPQYDFPSLVRQKVKESVEESNLTETSDAYLDYELFSMLSDYRSYLMKRVSKLLRELSQGNVPFELFYTDDELEQLVSAVSIHPYYEKSFYKQASLDSISLMTVSRLTRPSKYELIANICFELYTSESNTMLFLIETVPKLMGDNYVQSVLPKFIAVADSDTDFKMVMTTLKNSFFKGIFCGKLTLLEKDCNVHERKGCKQVTTPKKVYEAELRDNAAKIAKEAASPKIEL